MTQGSVIYFILFFVLLLAAVKPLGGYMAKVYLGEDILPRRALGWLESLFYRLGAVNPNTGMTWKQYMAAVLLFNAGGFFLVYVMLLCQGFLPWNPLHLPSLEPDLAFNVAASFVTNTDWESYSAEKTLSPLSQTFGLTVQGFLSAATGLAVLAALLRGLIGKERRDIGNFWVDIIRGCLYILLPLSLLLAIVLISQGVVQSNHALRNVPLLQSAGSQLLALGPVASQLAIMQVGSNGGGYFNANSAHPFSNPTAITNFLELYAMLLIPASLCYSFGRMVNDRRQGWALLAAMLIMFVPLLSVCAYEEQVGNPTLSAIGVDQSANFLQSGGNMEGKEVRLGIAGSSLWVTTTAASSNGSVNAAHSSLTPIGGMVPLLLMQFGEVIFGGVGSGMYGMLLYVLIAVFISGLMVGRTPEYLGKKIQSFEIKMASIAIMIPGIQVLLGTALGVASIPGIMGQMHHGPHGFSEVLYAFSSSASNNGSSFGGLAVNSIFYNTILGIVMLFGRFWVIIPVLAIAGSMGQKKAVPASKGTLPTHSPLFVLMLISVIALIGVLTFIPALSLGPIAESLQNQSIGVAKP